MDRIIRGCFTMILEGASGLLAKIFYLHKREQSDGLLSLGLFTFVLIF